MSFIRFLKDWTLPVAIATGVSSYLLFRYMPALDAVGDQISPVVDVVFSFHRIPNATGHFHKSGLPPDAASSLAGMGVGSAIGVGGNSDRIGLSIRRQHGTKNVVGRDAHLRDCAGSIGIAGCDWKTGRQHLHHDGICHSLVTGILAAHPSSIPTIRTNGSRGFSYRFPHHPAKSGHYLGASLVAGLANPTICAATATMDSPPS